VHVLSPVKALIYNVYIYKHKNKIVQEPIL